MTSQSHRSHIPRGMTGSEHKPVATIPQRGRQMPQSNTASTDASKMPRHRLTVHRHYYDAPGRSDAKGLRGPPCERLRLATSVGGEPRASSSLRGLKLFGFEVRKPDRHAVGIHARND